jgi:hypothetical protein
LEEDVEEPFEDDLVEFVGDELKTFFDDDSNDDLDFFERLFAAVEHADTSSCEDWDVLVRLNSDLARYL